LEGKALRLSLYAEGVAEILSRDLGGRGVSHLLSPSLLLEALDLCLRASSALVVTGFFVPRAGAPETDGPMGAVALARALLECEKEVRLVTDSLCAPAVIACLEAVELEVPLLVADSSQEVEALGALGAELVVALERLGRASDGRFYNMRGEDVSPFTAPLDLLFLGGSEGVVFRVGIGDGGNEMGMANFRERICASAPQMAPFLTVVDSDVAVPCNVSNLGGHALAAALALSSGSRVWDGRSLEAKMLEAMSEVGCVDGITLGRGTVDAIPLPLYLDMVDTIYSLALNA